jgi:hypothetical protein
MESCSVFSRRPEMLHNKLLMNLFIADFVIYGKKSSKLECYPVDNFGERALSNHMNDHHALD